ncbi:MAG: alpha/beta fold hydrolase [Methanospirillum sp.]
MARPLPLLCALVLLLALLLAGCLGAGEAAVPPAANASPNGTPVPNATHGATMTNTTATLVFRDPDLSFELVRTLGKALGHGADVGESLETARRIAAHEPEGLRPVLDAWYREWNATAERIHAIGVGCEAKNHTVSAGEAYLRASEYYRAADFFLHDNPANPEIGRLWDAMHTDFVRGLQLTGVRFEEVEIPYGNTTLYGYFFPAHADGRRAPTIIVHQGFDGTAEECWFGVGADAVARGYNVLAFDGPGQGRAIRKQGLHFRPDWENVVTPVLNWTLLRRDVDPARVVLYGISMGGYLAPRAAAYEPRLRAVIANEGVYDVFENDAFAARMTPDQLRDFIENEPDMYNQAVAGMIRNSTQLYWATTHGEWAFGVATPAELMKAHEAYTVNGSADRIRCPVLVLDVESEQFFADQSRQLYDALPPGLGTMITFGASEGAGLHCQAGAQLLGNQRIFDWLDEELARTGKDR